MEHELDSLVNINLLILQILVISLSKWLTDISHGEGRSAAATTFHIAVQLTSAGDHKTHIKFGHKVLAGSEVNWKAKRPSLQRVLNTYKTKYGAEITTSESSSNNEEGNPGNAWQNKIMKANDGTFFYLDEDDVYHACNEAGEDL